MMKYSFIDRKESPETDRETDNTFSFNLSDRDIFDVDIDYNLALPSNIDIFSKLDLSCVPEELQSRITKFIKIFKKLLYIYSTNLVIEKQLSKLIVSRMSDGSIALEWNYHHFRVDFFFELDDLDSSYTIVCDDKISGNFDSSVGILTVEKYEEVIAKVLSFVLGRT